MAENSKIEWTDHTFNPWIGCQEVSAACDNCYARVQNNFRGWVNGWGPHGERKRTKTWGKPKAWNRDAAAQGIRLKVFCASLADVFDNKVPTEWRTDLWALIRATPYLDWLLLTKRPQNISKMLPTDWGSTGYPNVWLGVTGETNDLARERAMHAVVIPAAVHFMSVEPMLGPVEPIDGIDWVICGGESAKGTHRPMKLKWARDLRDHCRSAGMYFFMKQIDKVQPIPDDLMVREFPQVLNG